MLLSDFVSCPSIIHLHYRNVFQILTLNNNFWRCGHVLCWFACIAYLNLWICQSKCFQVQYIRAIASWRCLFDKAEPLLYVPTILLRKQTSNLKAIFSMSPGCSLVGWRFRLYQLSQLPHTVQRVRLLKPGLACLHVSVWRKKKQHTLMQTLYWLLHY